MTDQTKNIGNVGVNPAQIKKSVGGKGHVDSSGFNSFLGAVDAMAPMNTEIMYQATGRESAAAVLNGAFTGMSGAAGAYGYGPAGGAWGGYGGMGTLAEYPGMMGVGAAGTYSGYAGGYKSVGTTTGTVAGTGLPTGDLINTMNSNNLQLLELQATMQSNMQAWNTKSNILSADHRARMAMIEKFTAR